MPADYIVKANTRLDKMLSYIAAQSPRTVTVTELAEHLGIRRGLVKHAVKRPLKAGTIANVMINRKNHYYMRCDAQVIAAIEDGSAGECGTVSRHGDPRRRAAAIVLRMMRAAQTVSAAELTSATGLDAKAVRLLAARWAEKGWVVVLPLPEGATGYGLARTHKVPAKKLLADQAAQNEDDDDVCGGQFWHIRRSQSQWCKAPFLGATQAASVFRIAAGA